MFHFDWIKRHAERTPDRLAIVDAAADRRFTYAEWDRRIERLAAFMAQELKLTRGDRVSILAQSSADYYEILFACGRLGVILNTLNWRLAEPELAYIITDCTPRFIFYEGQYAATVAALAQDYPFENGVCLGDKDAGADHHYRYEDAITQGGAALTHARPHYNDTWAIIYTSGTTGRPKGAQVTYGNFFYNAVGMGQAIGLTANDVNLNVLPTFHIGGLGLYACPTWHAGGAVVVMRSFDPQEFLQLVEKWGVTVVLLVPAIYLMLQQHDRFAEFDLSSLRLWSSGGSALPPSLVDQYADRGIIIQQGFGMTETGPTVFLIDRENAVRKAGSVGKPVLHTDVSIMDRDDRPLGPGEIGELCIRGGNVTSGYWNRPEATAEALRNEWLHSGDAAMMDEEGFYYIVDRWKDMFISGGENVYPAEVENVFYQHPAVAEVAVIGVSDPKWQEVGRAIVVLKPGMTANSQELIDFCQGKLARYKIPKSILFSDGLPRNAAGKVLKRELRQTHGGKTA